MINPHDLLTNTLLDIESDVKTNVTANSLAKKHYISSIHLQRMFKFAFEQPLGSYIKQRKLAASLDCLTKTDMSILNIALEYGFEYEQTYIRAFKRLFGITPGEVRKNNHFINITPPLHLYDSSKIDNGIILKPLMVMIPKFYVVGKRHKILWNDSKTQAPVFAKQFWHNERELIENILNPNVYIGLTRVPHDGTVDYSFYLPSVQVENLKNIPHGLEGDEIEASLCMKFRYIGRHHYYDINADVAHSLYDTIHKLRYDSNFKYKIAHNKMFFERIDIAAYDGMYCQMEWFTPVYEA